MQTDARDNGRKRLAARGREDAGRVHFVGVGGVGMSGLALLLKDRGWTVTGSDLGGSEELGRLREAGIALRAGHESGHLPQLCDLVIRTQAVDDRNPEVVAAKKRGLEVMSYPVALGAVGSDRESVAVAGTHGKTTTAAMLAAMLEAAGLEPGAVIGGSVPQIGGGVLFGEGSPFVMEACEYRESFLELGPRHALLLNVDADHLDHYLTMDRLRQAFRNFAKQVDADGVVVTTSELAHDLDIRGATKGRVITIGSSKHDVQLRRESGGFLLTHPDGTRSGLLPSPLPGRHNELNAAMAAVMAHKAYGIAYDDVRRALASFRGVGRRFELLIDRDDLVLIDDYAHHPTEIEATLLAARERYPGRPLVAVFQPHLADRTERHFCGFLNALAMADEVLMLRDYRVVGRDEAKVPQTSELTADSVEPAVKAQGAASEGAPLDRGKTSKYVRQTVVRQRENLGPKSSEGPAAAGARGARDLRDELRRLSFAASFHEDFDDAAEFLCHRPRRGAVWVVMGAGDVRELSRKLHARLR